MFYLMDLFYHNHKLFWSWPNWRVNKKLNQNLEQIILNLEGNKSVFKIADELEIDFYDVLNYLEKFFENDLITKSYLCEE